MFEYGTKETWKSEVEVKDVSRDTMASFLEFLYIGSCDCLEKRDVESVIELYLIADRYLVDDLKYVCGEVIEAGITIKNCLKIWALANSYEDLYRITFKLRDFSWG